MYISAYQEYLLGKTTRAIIHVTRGLEIMVQLTWFALPCCIIFLVSLISSTYWLSLVTGSLDAFLFVALIVKIGTAGKEKIDPCIAKKTVELEH